MRSLRRNLPTRQSLTLAASVALAMAAGCADVATDIGMRTSAPPTIPPKVERLEPTAQTGRAAAVLSIHMRKSYQDACKFGLTLTNNLPYKVTALTYRITAIIKGDVPFDTQNKSFSEIRPGERQYRELTFQKVPCDQISRLDISDPGRCNVSELNRFNANPGDCAKFTDVPSSKVVNVAWKHR